MEVEEIATTETDDLVAMPPRSQSVLTKESLLVKVSTAILNVVDHALV